MKPPLTTEETVAIKNLEDAVKALPKTLKLTVDDCFHDYPELIIWKEDHPGSATGVGCARCKIV